MHLRLFPFPFHTQAQLLPPLCANPPLLHLSLSHKLNPTTTMPTISSFLPTFFILLSSAPVLLSSTPIFFPLHRRILHQPFFPLGALPPSAPPSPSPPQPQTPQIPFSSSTPNHSPFFPSLPSPPPPPPSPSAFASFPANISSLILPQSHSGKSNSHKLLALAIAAVVSAVLVAGISVFFYFRRSRERTPNVADEKSFRSHIAETNNTSHHKLRTSSTTSSEFLYLGTLVNSRRIEDSGRSNGNGNVGGNNSIGSSNLDLRKVDSPELRPLPPLTRQSSVQNYGKGGDKEEEEDDEFYSPRVSLEGKESSSGTGSGSRRVFAALGSENLGGRSTDLSSISDSSSSSGSPARSLSLSLSPPVSLSPRRSVLKSPESSAAQAPPPPPPLQNHYTMPLRTSSPSPSYSSPERGLEQNPEESRRVSNILDRNVRSPAALSPERGLGKNADVSLRTWNVSDLNDTSDSASPASSSSPSRRSERSSDASPRLSSVSDQIAPSRPSSSSSRRSARNSDASPRIFNVSDQIARSLSPSPHSSSPDRVSESSHVSDRIPQSPARIISASHQSVLVSPPLPPSPPPPPPPPPPPTQRDRVTPTPSTPIGQPICKPPPLIPPSRPFVLQNPLKISPVELPSTSETMEMIEETPKPKLKPLHWDKVRASSDREMVWDQLRSSSFKLNEEMIETLFVVNASTPKPKDTTPRTVLPTPKAENRVLDPKKSQNIAILLRALNVTIEEVCEALLEGNADTLGAELLENLLRMAPTKEEERKLKEYKDDSPVKLGPAEKFLKAVVDVPFAFKRVDAMLYIANFESEVDYLKRSFDTLEGACEELRNSRMFMKLLEAVLKTGNRMNVGTNRGDAHAFKLDTLLKLADVKGADGKTTLLHFVVQEIIRTEGARHPVADRNLNSTLNEDSKCRKLGLQVVSGLSSELTNVKKAAAMDSDVLISDVAKLSRGIDDIREVVRLIETVGVEESSQKFSESMNVFIKMAEEEIIRIQAQESVALSLVKEITEYFHGNSAKEEAHPFRIFMVVRDFLTVLDRVCKEVGMINERTIISSAHKFPVPVNPTLTQAFPGSHGHGRQQYSSSDDESASP